MDACTGSAVLSESFSEFARIAKRLVTVSEFSKGDIVEQFRVLSGVIDAVYNAPDSIYAQGTTTDRAAGGRFTNSALLSLWAACIQGKPEGLA